MRCIEDSALPLLPDFGPAYMSELLWAMAFLGHRPSDNFTLVSQRMAHERGHVGVGVHRSASKGCCLGTWRYWGTDPATTLRWSVAALQKAYERGFGEVLPYE